MFSVFALIVLICLPNLNIRTNWAAPNNIPSQQWETEQYRARQMDTDRRRREAILSDLQTDTKVCPDCAETIRAAAKVCRFCGHRLA
ncbi:zinc ribbon domain-containing protein [Labrys sp. KB_33_2]|uniref:zinc ribbon domain-containing protein n=1 Tax=Labrys sp. KB_33_2 TaxID=3237479 RepID=UPI003F903B19